MQCSYRLCKYMYKNSSIYKKGWFFYHKISDNTFTYKQGVREVNRLCGIIEEPINYSSLTPVAPERLTNNIEGNFIVNFKNQSSCFDNDPMPAKIKPYNGRLDVEWVNGSSCVIDVNYINIWELDN